MLQQTQTFAPKNQLIDSRGRFEGKDPVSMAWGEPMPREKIAASESLSTPAVPQNPCNLRVI